MLKDILLYANVSGINELYRIYINILQKYQIDEVLTFDEFKLRMEELGTFATTSYYIDNINYYLQCEHDTVKRNAITIMLYDNLLCRTNNGVYILMDLINNLEIDYCTPSILYKLIDKCVYYSSIYNLYAFIVYIRCNHYTHGNIIIDYINHLTTSLFHYYIKNEISLIKRIKFINIYASVYKNAAYNHEFEKGMNVIIKSNNRNDVTKRTVFLLLLFKFKSSTIINNKLMKSIHSDIIDTYRINMLKQILRVTIVI